MSHTVTIPFNPIVDHTLNRAWVIYCDAVREQPEWARGAHLESILPPGRYRRYRRAEEAQDRALQRFRDAHTLPNDTRVVDASLRWFAAYRLAMAVLAPAGPCSRCGDHFPIRVDLGQFLLPRPTCPPCARRKEPQK